MHAPRPRRLPFRTAARALRAAALAAVALVAACARDNPAPTAPAGGTVSLYTYPSAIYRNHLEFGTPADGNATDDYVMTKRTHALSYNRNRGGPNWVSWDLNKTHYGDAARSSSFYTDPDLPSTIYHVTTSDYTNGGYDRGHMARSEERTWDATDNKAVFQMSNILPQTHDMNGGPWYKFEAYLQDLAQNQNKELYVIAGGYGSLGTLKGEGKVTIPSHTWKVVVVMPYGQGLANVTSTSSLQVIAVDMPNTTGIISAPWTNYQTTVDKIEAATGYNLLDKLPDSIETYWESR